MGIQNDNRMYSGGNVAIDQRPHVALYGQLLARNQAREEAYDEYVRNLNKGINSAGVRNVDRPVFDKKYENLQNFYIQNRDAIRNRKGGADIKYAQMHQDLLNLVAESKQEEEKKKPVVEMMLDPNKRDRLNNDEFMKAIHDHDQPLYAEVPEGLIRNPNRKSVDYTSFNFNPKPFEQDKYFKQYEDIKRTDLPPVIVKDPKTMTQTETTTSTFDDDAKNTIATRAVTDYMHNPSFKKVVDELDPKDYNDFYRQNFGHDIKTPADLAAAYTLKGMQQSIKTSKVSPDVFGRQVALEGIRDDNAKRRLAIQDAYAKGRIDYRKAAGKKEQEGVLEGLIQRTFEEGEKNKTPVYVDGKAVVGRKVAVPAEISKKYTITEGSGTKKTVKTPIKFIMTEDMKYIVPVYPGESTKNREGKIPIEQFRNDLGKLYLTKKDAAAEMDEIDFGEDEDDDNGSGMRPSAPAKKPATATKKHDPLGLF